MVEVVDVDIVLIMLINVDVSDVVMLGVVVLDIVVGHPVELTFLHLGWMHSHANGKQTI